MSDQYAYQEINPLWCLVDPLTVEQAAASIAGFDPNSVDESGNWFEDQETGLTDSDGITWVRTAFVALVNAVNARKLKAPFAARLGNGGGRRAGRG